ncbi:MAG: DUF5317 domain-containing protein [Candidatus Cryosericum sp.]
MFVLVVLAGSLCLSLVTGGRLRYVQDFQLKALPIGIGAFVVQLLIFTARGETLLGSLLPVVYILTLIALLVFLFINRTVFGMPLLMVGLVLNLLVIGANSGRMPADPRALIATGQSSRAETLERDRTAANCVLMSEETHLNFLGDRIVLPLLGTLGAAYSAGDLVALAGEAVLVYGMVRERSKARKDGHTSSESDS